MAAITDPAKAGALLRAIDGYDGSFIVKCAMRLAPLVFVRPGELRHAEWAEINFDRAEWNIPAEKMKMKAPHLVPLSKQAMDILRELEPLTAAGRYVFPGGRSTARVSTLIENHDLPTTEWVAFEKRIERWQHRNHQNEIGSS